MHTEPTRDRVFHNKHIVYFKRIFKENSIKKMQDLQ